MTKKAFMLVVLSCAACALVTSSCNDKSKIYAANDAVYKNLDTTVKPGDDFFKYANGAWLKKNPIPAAYPAWGIGNVVEE